MKVSTIMDINSLALGIKGWIPIYYVGTGVSYLHYYSAYFPFRSADKFVNLDITRIQDLLINERINLQRTPQMIPRVLVRQIS
jgi:hypothetical protein